jgi:ParB family chromosome partitioning protein
MVKTSGRGLGRGFEALLSNDFDKGLVLDENERIQKLAVDVIVPNSGQPRRYFDEKAMHELADSIKSHGVLLPLVVTSLPKGKYRIVAGERRWRASKLAGLEHVPAVVRTMKDLEQLEVSLIENVQRVDLSPLEQAQSLQKLHDQFSMPFEKIAKRLGKASSTVNNTVRLLHLPAEAQEALIKQKISEGHARAILALKGQPDQQGYLLEAIQVNSWSVRQAERYVTSLKDGVSEKSQVHARVETETPLTKDLGKRLGTTVHLKRMAHGGRLEISFKSDDQLEQIIKRMY